MKKFINIEKFLFILAILLMVGFAVRLGADYYQYQTGINSAPFSAAILVRSVEFLLPSAICAGIVLYFKRKHQNSK